MTARNWRSLGRSGERYPEWLQQLRKSSGVYAIREIGFFSNPVLYVGESHSGRLLKTISRHFAIWGRAKEWWKGVFSATDPGRTYERSACEVCVLVLAEGPCSKAAAVRAQNNWIRELEPRDNIQGTDEAPSGPVDY